MVSLIFGDTGAPGTLGHRRQLALGSLPRRSERDIVSRSNVAQADIRGREAG